MKPKPLTEQQKTLTNELLKGNQTIEQSLLASGYGPSQARKGVRRVPKAVLRLLKKTPQSNLMELGNVDPKTQETVARGRLMYGALTGSDRGVAAAKQLGADKRIAMWQPDSQTGIVVLGDLQIGGQTTEDKLLEAPEESQE